MGFTESEVQRLTDQGRLAAPYTRALLLEAGVRPGMRVLDVGCGAGDVSLLAAELVGPSGEVVGLDINARALELARARAAAIGATQVTFVQADLREFPVDTLFDVAVGRLVLMYLADPAGVVRRVAQHVRPGGIVAFQELQIEHASLASSPVPLWDQWHSWILQAFRYSHAETNMGIRLRQTFLDAGLPTPQLHMDVRLVSAGDELQVRNTTNALRSILPLLERFGVATADEVDVDTFGLRYANELAISNAVHSTIPIVRAWTRTP
jgi:SAM-dependent methyltransferase